VLIDEESLVAALNSLYQHTFQGTWLLEKMPEWLILFVLTQIILEFVEKYSPGIFFAIFFGKVSHSKKRVSYPYVYRSEKFNSYCRKNG
jgi:hypothetical protein